VVQEAHVNGISTRKVDRPVETLRLAGTSKDQVARLCQGLAEQVGMSAGWSFDQRFAWPDAAFRRR
jgi:putative transposase